jgi:hypothetical protein
MRFFLPAAGVFKERWVMRQCRLMQRMEMKSSRRRRFDLLKDFSPQRKTTRWSIGAKNPEPVGGSEYYLEKNSTGEMSANCSLSWQKIRAALYLHWLTQRTWLSWTKTRQLKVDNGRLNCDKQLSLSINWSGARPWVVFLKPRKQNLTELRWWKGAFDSCPLKALALIDTQGVIQGSSSVTEERSAALLRVDPQDLVTRSRGLDAPENWWATE